jgi:YggT family protein
MNILSELIVGLLMILNNLVMVYMWVVIISALLSWVRPDPYNPIVQVLYRLTQPAYAFVRKTIPTMFNGIDLSPLVIIIGLNVLQVLITALARAIAL